jgi:hypothetical protein
VYLCGLVPFPPRKNTSGKSPPRRYPWSPAPTGSPVQQKNGPESRNDLDRIRDGQYLSRTHLPIHSCNSQLIFVTRMRERSVRTDWFAVLIQRLFNRIQHY